MGQLPANLFHGRTDQFRATIEQKLGGGFVTGRLVIVSNRLAVVREGETPVGGLAVAVHAALKDQGGIWFGWSGEVTAQPSNTAEITKDGRMRYATIDLTRRELNEYYSGFANSVLWPLFHYRMGLVSYRRTDFDSYVRVNQRFARALIPLLQPTDTIWVHDYHLLPLGEQLRREGVTQTSRPRAIVRPSSITCRPRSARTSATTARSSSATG
jgi:trehalose-6-phosphate synthase